MRLILIAIVIAALGGCASSPTKYSFPDLPTDLMVEPDSLKTLKSNADLANILLTDESPSDVKMSDVLRVVTENYKISNKYLEQIRSLQKWIRLEKDLNP